MPLLGFVLAGPTEQEPRHSREVCLNLQPLLRLYHVEWCVEVSLEEFFVPYQGIAFDHTPRGYPATRRAVHAICFRIRHWHRCVALIRAWGIFSGRTAAHAGSSQRKGKIRPSRRSVLGARSLLGGSTWVVTKASVLLGVFVGFRHVAFRAIGCAHVVGARSVRVTLFEAILPSQLPICVFRGHDLDHDTRLESMSIGVLKLTAGKELDHFHIGVYTHEVIQFWIMCKKLRREHTVCWPSYPTGVDVIFGRKDPYMAAVLLNLERKDR